MTDTHLTETRFDSFDLDPRILKALDEVGFTHCTPIQAETLPIGLAGRDVAGQAQTGTGKTAAFLIVTIQRLLTSPSPPAGQGSHPRVLILAPTRELAVQIHRDTLALTKYTDFRVGLVYGGTGYQQQRDDLARGVDILIERKSWLLHPFGFAVDATPTGDSFSLTELRAAATWNRVVPRKTVPMAFLKTNG